MSGTDRHMRPSDAFAWYMERDPLLRSTVVVLGVLDRTPDLEVLRARVEHATRAVPAFRDRLVQPPLRLARPRWVRVDSVDLDWHLRHVSAPAPGDLSKAVDVARIAATSAFDPARPLWHSTLVGGLEGGRAAFVLAYHHSLTDGIGGVRLMEHLFDLTREGSDRTPVEPEQGEHLDGWRLLWDTAAYDAGRTVRRLVGLPRSTAATTLSALRHPGDAVRTMTSVARTVEPYFTTLSPVMRERHLDRSLHLLEVSTAGLHDAAKAHGGQLNDAFLAAVTGGLRRYHALHGTEVGDLRMTLPLSLRRPEDPEGGNRITLLRFPLPAGTEDPGDRLRRIHEVVLGWRHARSLPHTQAIAAGLNLLPASFVGGMLKHVDFLASDVPGVPVPLYLAGARVEAWYPFGPTIGASVNLTLMSYADTCCIGVNVDTAAVPDPDRLVDCLVEGFQEVLVSGGQEPVVRRPLASEGRTAKEPVWTS
jgi:diacylglycerol O-acyltransferase